MRLQSLDAMQARSLWQRVVHVHRDRQVSVDLLRELHPLALLPVDVDDEAVHLAAEPAYEARDDGLVRAPHLSASAAAPRRVSRTPCV